MAYGDSVDKIVTYIEAVTNQDFTYKGKIYKAKPMVVSPFLLRGFKCPAMCGGCCNLKFSLDYIPSEIKPYELVERQVDFDGRKVTVWSDFQVGNEGKACKHLDLSNGRCMIHMKHPFSCDFEVLKFLHRARSGDSVAITKLFGRGWAMTKVDGTKGALCEITPPDQESITDLQRKLRRLDEWCQHFGIVNNKCQEVINWSERQRNTPLEKVKPLVIGVDIDQLEFI